MRGGSGTQRIEAGLRLHHRHDAARHLQGRAQIASRPVEPRAPALCLMGGEIGILAILIADQIIAAIGGELGQYGITLRRHPVDHRHGKAEDGHAAGVDLLALRVPFRRDGRGERRCRQPHRASRRCLHRAPVEMNGDTILLAGGRD